VINDSLEERLAAVRTEVHDRRREEESAITPLREEEKMLVTLRNGIQALLDEEKEVDRRCEAARERLQAQKESETQTEELIDEQEKRTGETQTPHSSSGQHDHDRSPVFYNNVQHPP
jgi:hypothetical protein